MNQSILSRREVLGCLAGGATVIAYGISSIKAGAQVSTQWSEQIQLDYAKFAKEFVSTYIKKIDCADLAILTLVRFAAANDLPVRIFDYAGSAKRWLVYDPKNSDPDAFARLAMRELGAVNLIENSVPVALPELRAGDLIMTERNAPDSTGHTRIVTAKRYDEAAKDWLINWYQGTIPPALPEPREYLFREMPNPHKLTMLPRRWHFAQFEGAASDPSNKQVPTSPWKITMGEEWTYFLLREFSDGTRLELFRSGGRHVSEGVVASNAKWKTIGQGAAEIRFDPAIVDLPAGVIAEHYVRDGRGNIGIDTVVDETALSSLFANARRVQFKVGGKVYADLSLEGSATALKQLEARMLADYEASRYQTDGDD